MTGNDSRRGAPPRSGHNERLFLAVLQTGLSPAETIGDWRAQRRNACCIGHVDLLARPSSGAL
ncbi:hypothetical protein CQW49_22090 (plasmid) [Methylosinus trichosporium OB3b]|uniref:Uncharacterized protein n=1 Tax=Methylosinus trichosporium (strain ATCC 35070 / NCIMB 11131 / UNIQEM 75 / OB3b) TaxID=595536 RepID=A0A2D2D6S3_METT3|nr:hypothetical protein CQW49_22090 [Methylosinus trichosporium OB3b]OBS52834.1 hypothetical protein A8B73_09110 [Methylosinus sp. 3S-1]